MKHGATAKAAAFQLFHLVCWRKRTAQSRIATHTRLLVASHHLVHSYIIPLAAPAVPACA